MDSWLLLVSVAIFSVGVYLMLSKPQVFLILLGAELIVHAAALNFLMLRGPTARSAADCNVYTRRCGSGGCVGTCFGVCSVSADWKYEDRSL